MHRFISGPSIPIHLFMCLFLCQYPAVLIAMGLQYIFGNQILWCLWLSFSHWVVSWEIPKIEVKNLSQPFIAGSLTPVMEKTISVWASKRHKKGLLARYFRTHWGMECRPSENEVHCFLEQRTFVLFLKQWAVWEKPLPNVLAHSTDLGIFVFFWSRLI